MPPPVAGAPGSNGAVSRPRVRRLRPRVNPGRAVQFSPSSPVSRLPSPVLALVFALALALVLEFSFCTLRPCALAVSGSGAPEEGPQGRKGARAQGVERRLPQDEARGGPRRGGPPRRGIYAAHSLPP